MRTKKVTFEVIPTIENVMAVANYGPAATLFALGRNHTVQQYDITPNQAPMQVASVQHVPANTPPTPPTVLQEHKNPSGEPRTAVSTEAPVLTLYSEPESSADEGGAMSPLQKIAREMDSLDAMESELRDRVMPLSPSSSRTSSVSSKSSGSRSSRKGRKYLYDPPSSRASSSPGFNGTEFSSGDSIRLGHESMSIHSVSSYASKPRHIPSTLRKDLLRDPSEGQHTASMDLFPFTKAKLREVAFRTPHYGTLARTPEVLQREMLSVVFGWRDDVRSLIRDELARQRPASASAVLLTKWLGEVGADSMASGVCNESMTSSDWMLLALSSIGQDSQKQVGEAFVQRLLEKGDIHPAVAILLGFGENSEAIEVYVSQGYWMEAVLLTCLTSPSDWGRVSFLIRKWGEYAVQHGEPELAVRCFSCTSVETSEPWFSPRAQDAVYTAQQLRLTDPQSAGPVASPPVSPPSRSGSGRLTAMNASLKLITTFGDKGAPAASLNEGRTPMAGAVPTPIAESAVDASGQVWRKVGSTRDPSEVRTATPGGFGRRKRLPSRSDIDRVQRMANELSPAVTAHDRAPKPGSPAGHMRRTSNVSSIPEPVTALKPTVYASGSLTPGVRENNHLPSPSDAVFTRLREQSRAGVRASSRDRKPDGLAVQVVETRYTDNMSPAPSTGASESVRSAATGKSGANAPSPPLTNASVKARALDNFISSVEVARQERASSKSRAESRQRGESRPRGESRTGRTGRRMRGPSETRDEDRVRFIVPAKRSPSSPVPLSPAEVAQASQGAEVEPANTDDESFYKIASPVESHRSGRSALSAKLANIGGRGRNGSLGEGAPPASPLSPVPMPQERRITGDADVKDSDGQRVHMRARSSSRHPDEDLQSRRAASRTRRERSSSRRPAGKEESGGMLMSDVLTDNPAEDDSVSSMRSESRRPPRGMSRKEAAALELEQRRLSLARRPSAPPIPMPAQLSSSRPGMGPRSNTELGNSPTSYLPPMSRSHTVDPGAMARHNHENNKRLNGVVLPPMGLPATPRAMRHPRYMSADPEEREGAPPMPQIPGNFSDLSSPGAGSLTGSSLSQAPSSIGQLSQSQVSSSQASNGAQPAQVETDDLGPLLPSTVFGQKASQPPPRSASAPPENMQSAPVHPAYKAGLPSSNRRQSLTRGHVRKISPPDVSNPPDATAPAASIDAALHGDGEQQQVVFISEGEEAPPSVIILPELQHLAGPPPPPPPPTMFHHHHYHQGSSSDVINIAIDPTPSVAAAVIDVPALPAPMDRAHTVSPATHRHHRPRQSSVSETFGSRFFRGAITDRIRTPSRSRAKSPPVAPAASSDNTATTQNIVASGSQHQRPPYETVLHPVSNPQPQYDNSTARAKSPYEQAMAAGGQDQQIPPPPPPPPPPPAAYDGRTQLQETTIPPPPAPPQPSQPPIPRSQSATGYYRSPKEIRANMPPVTLQQGVYDGGGFL